MSADWTQGYVTDTLYTDSFFRELSPVWLNYVAVLKGCLPIDLDAPFTYLELGCGLGRSTTVFAGAFPHARFIGVDFNPAHISLAERYADTIGIENVEFWERGFADLAEEALPPCDFIVLHGVYSWISPETRQSVRRIILKHLKPGGLVYISYNALPGWAAASPLRKLMVEAASQAGGDVTSSLNASIRLMEEFSKAEPGYFRANPAAANELKNLRARGENYLAHEFLNSEWGLLYGVDVADEMAEAKLNYLGSATLVENHIDLLVDEAVSAQINAQRSARLRDLMLDYAVNQRFRRDVFIRGHQSLSKVEQDAVFSLVSLGTTRSEAEFTQKVEAGNREIAFSDGLFSLIKKAALSGAKTVAEYRAACAGVTQRKASIDNLLTTLVAAGHLAPFVGQSVAAPSDLAGPLAIPNPVNARIIENVVATRARQQLVSRVAGSGVAIDAVEALILQLILSGTSREALLDRLPSALESQGLQLVSAQSNSGSAINEGSPSMLQTCVWRFDEKLSVLKRCGIVCEL